MTAKPTRKQQTRRRRRAVFILLLAAVLCGVGFYCVSVFCRATHIEVTGSTRYAAEDIIEAADIGEEQNIFTISQKALNERITALCPYIECVTLHRRLPDTLELELHEFNTIYACIGSMGHHPFRQWQGAGAVCLSAGVYLSAAWCRFFRLYRRGKAAGGMAEDPGRCG